MCIYKEAYKTAGTRQKFWDYIKIVHEECDNVLNEECSKLGQRKVDIDWEKTQSCVENGFSDFHKENWVKKGVENHMIEKDIEYWKKYGTNLFPSIVINN